jgi:hypothetical protein
MSTLSSFGRRVWWINLLVRMYLCAARQWRRMTAPKIETRVGAIAAVEGRDFGMARR